MLWEKNMGRNITVYLTNYELAVLRELLTYHNSDSASQIVKNALVEMFSKDGLFLKEGHEKGLKKGIVIATKGASKHIKKIIVRKELKKSKDVLGEAVEEVLEGIV